MADDRNLTAHMYKEEIADMVCARLSEHLKLFQDLLKKLQQQQ